MQVPGLTPPDLKSYKTENKGAAIEVRLNAENPSTGFSPSSGGQLMHSAPASWSSGFCKVHPCCGSVSPHAIVRRYAAWC